MTSPLITPVGGAAGQRKQLEPDPEVAASYAADGSILASGRAARVDGTEVGDVPGVQDFLLRIPGINEFNVRKVVASVRTVADLATMTESQLSAVLGPTNGPKCHAFLHARVQMPT
jgi:hypothetical protein